MAKKETKSTNEQQVAPEAANVQPIGLSIQDLISITQLIQITTQRAAFRADELEQVGALYNKLIAFLQQTGAIQPVQQPQEETAPTEETKND